MQIKGIISRRKKVFYDIETFRNYGLFTLKVPGEEKEREIEFVDGDVECNRASTEELRRVYQHALKDWMLIGYNNRGYDNIVLLKLFEGGRSEAITPQEINDLSKQIIELQTLKFANIPNGFLSYDVYNFQNKMPSLKIVGTLFGGDIRETPISFSYEGQFDEEMREGVKFYCRHDVMITQRVFESVLGQKYFNMEVNMCQIALDELEEGCDPNIVWRMFSTSANYYETILKVKTKYSYKARRETMMDEFGIREMPCYKELVQKYGDWLKESDTETQTGLEIFNNVRKFFYSSEMFVERADSHGRNGISTEIVLRDGVSVKYGLGGAHGSCDHPLFVQSKNGHVILHADFSAMYPSIMIAFNIYPPNFPPVMASVFEQFAAARDHYKKIGDTDTSLAYKPILNSVPGRFKYQYSCMYHPATNFQICSIGQTLITFMSLIVKGRLIQLDTDGIMVLCRECDFEENCDRIQKMSDVIRLKIKVEKFDWFAQQNIHSYAFAQNGVVDGIGGFFGGKSEWDPNLIGIQWVVQQAIITGKSITDLIWEELRNNGIKNLVIVSKATAKFNAFKVEDYRTGNIETVKNRYMLSVAVDAEKAAMCGLAVKSVMKIGGEKVQKISSFPQYVVNVDTREDEFNLECVDTLYYANLIYSKMDGIADLLGIKK